MGAELGPPEDVGLGPPVGEKPELQEMRNQDHPWVQNPQQMWVQDHLWVQSQNPQQMWDQDNP